MTPGIRPADGSLFFAIVRSSASARLSQAIAGVHPGSRRLTIGSKRAARWAAEILQAGRSPPWKSRQRQAREDRGATLRTTSWSEFLSVRKRRSGQIQGRRPPWPTRSARRATARPPTVHPKRCEYRVPGAAVSPSTRPRRTDRLQKEKLRWRQRRRSATLDG